MVSKTNQQSPDNNSGTKDNSALARYIDHTLLKQDATPAQLMQLCEEAKKFNFKTVCINSSHLSQCVHYLKGSTVLPICVIGFPLGACATESKAFETQWCVANGAAEIDMVIAIGQLKAQMNEYVEKDIAAVVSAAQGKPVKVIIETSLLNTEEKMRACELSMRAGAHFVKTSTGFAGGGATVEDIQLMKKIVGNKLEVKASGGVKSSAQAWQLIEAGASRLGTSSGVALVSGQNAGAGY